MPSVKQVYSARANRTSRQRNQYSAKTTAARNVLRRGMRRRATRPRKKAVSSFVTKRNVEVKVIEHASESAAITVSTGSVINGPSNSLVFLSGLFGGDTSTSVPPNPGIQRGTGCNQMIVPVLRHDLKSGMTACKKSRWAYIQP